MNKKISLLAVVRANFARMYDTARGQNLFNFIYDSVKRFIADLFSIREGIRSFHSNNFELMVEHLELGNFKDVKLRYNLLKRFSTLPIEANYYMGLSCFMLDEFEQAKDYFKECTSLKDDSQNEVVAYCMAVINNDVSNVNAIPDMIIKSRYNSIAKDYDAAVSNAWQDSVQFGIYLEMKDYLQAEFGESKKFSLVDLGCGPGIFGRFASVDKLVSRIEGVDIAKNMIDISNTYLVDGKSTYSHYILGSLKEFFSYNESKFEVAVMIMTMNFTSDVENLIDNVSKIITASGVVVAYFKATSNKDTFFDAQEQVFVHNLESFKTLCDKYNLAIVREEDFERQSNNPYKLMILQRQYRNS